MGGAAGTSICPVSRRDPRMRQLPAETCGVGAGGVTAEARPRSLSPLREGWQVPPERAALGPRCGAILGCAGPRPR